MHGYAWAARWTASERAAERPIVRDGGARRRRSWTPTRCDAVRRGATRCDAVRRGHSGERVQAMSLRERTPPVTGIGLGQMGASLAEALPRAGHRTTVWNRSPAKADDLMALSRSSTSAG